MNRKMLAVVPAIAALALGPLAGTASAAEHEHDGPTPRHGHVLVLGVQYDEGGEPVGFRKCVDLAGGNALPLTAHHSTVHQGRAGAALEKAGHLVAPTAPYWPEVADCAGLIEFLGSGQS